VIRAYVETSGESAALATAEAVGAAEALGGRRAPEESSRAPDLVGVDLPDESAVVALAGRLALARRCLMFRADPENVAEKLEAFGGGGASAAVRRLGSPSAGGTDPCVLSAGRMYKAGGGRINLGAPERRFWLLGEGAGSDQLFEEVAEVDRRAASSRRMPTLPFQRPVALPPRLARAAANLARIRPGDRVLDPFVGTGALLAEAGLLGGRLYGIDRDAEMVRGALRNLAHLGLAAEELIVGDAGEAAFETSEPVWDAILTDPPYGRASSTGGEGSGAVIDRVLPRWAAKVRPGGRLVVIVPAPVNGPGDDWKMVVSVPVRVHRSLTREFRVYERAPSATSRA
jgi:putative methyltransferase (TIGR01177 family)